MNLIQYPDDLKSKFEFIAMAAHRCRQLQKGAKARVHSRSKKFTTIAQEEVLAGEVQMLDGSQVAEVLEALGEAPAATASDET